MQMHTLCKLNEFFQQFPYMLHMENSSTNKVVNYTHGQIKWQCNKGIRRID